MDKGDTQFDAFLSRIEPELASLEARYRQLRLKTMKFFSWRRCEDPGALADETISRCVKYVQSGQEIYASKPYSFVYGIAMNVFREYLRDRERWQSLSDSQSPPLPPAVGQLFDCRKECLASLSSERLVVLTRYYLDEGDRDHLAASLGISLNALRIQIHRIKRDMRDCYEECQRRAGVVK